MRQTSREKKTSRQKKTRIRTTECNFVTSHYNTSAISSVYKPFKNSSIKIIRTKRDRELFLSLFFRRRQHLKSIKIPSPRKKKKEEKERNSRQSFIYQESCNRLIDRNKKSIDTWVQCRRMMRHAGNGHRRTCARRS